MQPNPWLTEEIKAPTLLARLAIMMERADGFVAVRGGIGTLSEVTLAWSLLQTRTLDGKPLVLMGADWPPILDALRAAYRPGQLHRRAGLPCRTPRPTCWPRWLRPLHLPALRPLG